MIYINRPETLTQAYQAGILIAQVENLHQSEQIPAFVTCMVHFSALRELLGEGLWQRLKVSSKFKERIKLYEAMTYQQHLPHEIIGTSREFCLGYAKVYEKSKLKSSKDKKNADASLRIFDYLTSIKVSS